MRDIKSLFERVTLGNTTLTNRGKKREIYEGTGPYPMPREATREDISEG